MVERETSIEALRNRVMFLERQLQDLTRRRRQGRIRGFLVGAALLAATFVAGVATSQQTGECSGLVPFCFQGGDTVSASQMNENFTVLAQALEAKLDVSAEGDVDVAGTLGLGIYTKACSGSSGVTECSCESDELAISGGAAAPADGVLAQSRPRFSAHDTWQVQCTDLEGNQVACSSVRVICAKLRSIE